MSDMDSARAPYQGPVSGATGGSSFPDPVARRRRRLSFRVRRAIHVLGLGALVATGLLAVLVAISWVRSETAVDVVQAQLHDLKAGKVEAAYALFSAGYRAGVSLPMFRRWARHEELLVRAEDLQFWGRSVWGETAVLWGSFQDGLGHSYPVRYLLVRENGSWRIDGFHFSAKAPEPPPHTVRFIQI